MDDEDKKSLRSILVHLLPCLLLIADFCVNKIVCELNQMVLTLLFNLAYAVVVYVNL